MITENMKAFGLVMANSLQRLRTEGFTDQAALLLAAGEAEIEVPLEAIEQEEFRQMARQGRLGDLLPST